MVSRIWVVALGVVALAASCTSGSGAGPGAGGLAATSPPAGSPGRVCTPHSCISVSRLAGSIATQLKGNVVGYVALIGTSHVVASGLARTAADLPKLAMGPNVMVNVASVGKMFTTIAVLKSLARHHLSIDSRIWPFLPPDWVKGPGVGTITFRELLTHRAGFRLDSGRVFETDDAAREQIRHGVQQVDKRVADYNNIDFTIFRDMLPFMEGARQPGPAARTAAADRFFISHIQRQVLDPVGVQDATCGPVRQAMLMYPPPYAGTAPGKPAPVGPSACSAGGWFMTPASMLRVLEGLVSNRLLSGWQRQLMDASCLGWDCSVAGQPVPGQVRRHRRPRLSGPADLLRHPRGDHPGGDSHQLQRPSVAGRHSNRPAYRHQPPVTGTRGSPHWPSSGTDEDLRLRPSQRAWCLDQHAITAGPARTGHGRARELSTASARDLQAGLHGISIRTVCRAHLPAVGWLQN